MNRRESANDFGHCSSLPTRSHHGPRRVLRTAPCSAQQPARPAPAAALGRPLRGGGPRAARTHHPHRAARGGRRHNARTRPPPLPAARWRRGYRHPARTRPPYRPARGRRRRAGHRPRGRAALGHARPSLLGGGGVRAGPGGHVDRHTAHGRRLRVERHYQGRHRFGLLARVRPRPRPGRPGRRAVFVHPSPRRRAGRVVYRAVPDAGRGRLGYSDAAPVPMRHGLRGGGSDADPAGHRRAAGACGAAVPVLGHRHGVPLPRDDLRLCDIACRHRRLRVAGRVPAVRRRGHRHFRPVADARGRRPRRRTRKRRGCSVGRSCGREARMGDSGGARGEQLGSLLQPRVAAYGAFCRSAALPR